MIDKYIFGSAEYKLINSEIKNNKLSHAILLICKDSEYLFAFANALARAIICPDHKETNGELNCNVCNNIKKGVHPDCLVYGKEHTINAEEVTEIIDGVLVRPYSADKKVYIINNYDNANASCENKLLKTLEEPPADTVFILLATNINKLLPTTISRTQKYYINGFKQDELVELLKERKVNNAELIAMLSNNSLTSSNKLLSDGKTTGIADLCLDCMLNLNSTTNCFSFATAMENFIQDLPYMIDFFQLVARDALVIKCEKEELVENKINIDKIRKISTLFSFAGLCKIIEATYYAKKMIESNSASTNVIDQFLLKILEVKIKCKK